MHKILYLWVLALVSIFLYSCNNEKNQLFIVLSKDDSKSVSNWLKSSDSSMIITILYNKPTDSIEYYLNRADAVVITGGEDVNPELYNKGNLLEMCGSINKYRDSLEINMINYAFKNKLPLLGICRGLQIMNVSQGGSLIVDIPSIVGDSIHRNNGATKHLIYLENDSRLYKYSNVDTCSVYSNHHQAIENLSPIFKAVAYASDSVIEAIEIIDTCKFNFTLGIQWHPEKMDYNNELSKSIAKRFILKGYEHQNKN